MQYDTGKMSEHDANAVYDILVTEAGAYEGDRSDFVYHQTDTFHYEYRFMGGLGFGGKFRRQGYAGDKWYVDCYPENLNDTTREIIQRTNAALMTIPKENR